MAQTTRITTARDMEEVVATKQRQLRLRSIPWESMSLNSPVLVQLEATVEVELVGYWGVPPITPMAIKVCFYQ